MLRVVNFGRSDAYSCEQNAIEAETMCWLKGSFNCGFAWTFIAIFLRGKTSVFALWTGVGYSFIKLTCRVYRHWVIPNCWDLDAKDDTTEPTQGLWDVVSAKDWGSDKKGSHQKRRYLRQTKAEPRYPQSYLATTTSILWPCEQNGTRSLSKAVRESLA